MTIDIAILLSLASFLISIYTLWVTRLAGFALNVAPTARLELTTNPNSPGARQPGVILKLLFTNKGAHLGYVHDVATTVCKISHQSKPTLFRSLYEYIEESLNLTSQLPPPKLLAFSSFPILPSETVVKKIVFVPFDSQIEMKFEQGRYQFAIYTRDIKSGRKWRQWKTVEVDITADDLLVLQKTEAMTSEDRSQFVKWIIHSKPTHDAEYALGDLHAQLIKERQVRPNHLQARK